MILLLDPAHGGEKTGIVSPRGIVEADVNLAVALALKSLLEFFPLEVRLTRSGSEHVTSRERCEAAEQADMTLSLRQGRDPVSPRTYHVEGWAYDVPRHEASVQFARLAAGAVAERLGVPARFRAFRKYELLRGRKQAVTVVCGYLSCPEHEAKLRDGDGVADIAGGLFGAVTRWFGL